MKKPIQLIIAACILFISCEKHEHPEPSNGHGFTNSLTSVFFENVADATQNFTIDASNGGTIVGANGSSVHFQPKAFVHPMGNVVQGTVYVRLVEALTVGEMVRLNKQTVGMDDGTPRILNSGGQIRLNVSQGGQVLNLVPNSSTVTMPAPYGPDPNMEVFYGTENSSDGTVLWDPAVSTLVLSPDTFGYSFNNDSLGWINCDYFGNWPDLTDLVITPPEGYNDINTMFWVVFPQLNSMAGIYNFNSGSFFLSGGYQVPVGQEAVIISLHASGSDSYTSTFTNITITNGMVVMPSFQSTTLAQWELDCQAL